MAFTTPPTMISSRPLGQPFSYTTYQHLGNMYSFRHPSTPSFPKRTRPNTQSTTTSNASSLVMTTKSKLHRKPQFHANLGNLIETLREDYPQLMVKPPDLECMTDDITLCEHLTMDLHGKRQYLAFWFAFRLHCKVMFQRGKVEILSMFFDDNEDCLQVRWRLSAVPRIGNDKVIMDGLSLYKVNDDGMCYLHSLENTVPPKSTLQPFLVTLHSAYSRRLASPTCDFASNSKGKEWLP